MTPYTPFVPGINATGKTLDMLIEAVGSFSVLRETMLEVLGVPEVDVEMWFPQERVLRTYQKVESLLGGRGLERCGRLIAAKVALPPGISDAHTVLEKLDTTFHLNHRRDGVVMFDLATGEMLEGIGHYHYQRVGEREVVMTCDNPYPCRFDLGLVHGFAARFTPTVSVAHEPGACRIRGDTQCVYRATW